MVECIQRGSETHYFSYISYPEELSALAHGAAQGGLSELQGGKFIHGFISASLGSISTSAMTGLKIDNLGLQVSVSSAVGGTSSVLTGGSFANGAVTGAFTTIFNHMQHDGDDTPEENKQSNKEGVQNIQDGDIVGYGFSYGGTASIMGGVGGKYYEIWDMYGGHDTFQVPFGSIGVDLSAEISFVWIKSVGGNDFKVDDFSGFSSGYNIGILYAGYARIETKNFIVQEFGASYGVLLFSINISFGTAKPLQFNHNYNYTENYLKRGGLH